MDRNDLRQSFSEWAGTEIVDLFVGQSKKLFRVHKAILCKRVPYFDKMFNGEFKEAAAMSATLPEDNEDAFDLLIDWVYTGSVRNLTCMPKTRIYTWDPIKCYGLAEKFCLPVLADLIITTWQKHQDDNDELMEIRQAAEAYKSTSDCSPLRTYCLDYILYLFHFYKPPICPSKKHLASLVKMILAEDEELGEDFVHSFWADAKIPEDPRCKQFDYFCHT